MNSEYHMPECACLFCDAPTNCAGSPDGSPIPPPKDGDITMCLQCGAIMAHAADGKLRGLTKEEIDSVVADHKFMQYLAKLLRKAQAARMVHESRN
jgi:hypothetical protein